MTDQCLAEQSISKKVEVLFFFEKIGRNQIQLLTCLGIKSKVRHHRAEIGIRQVTKADRRQHFAEIEKPYWFIEFLEMLME